VLRTYCPSFKLSCTKSFRAITASTVIVCGVNPYWFLLIKLFEYILCIILFNSTFWVHSMHQSAKNLEGFDAMVTLQYCFHECIFVFLSVASYFLFSCRCCCFLVSLKLLSFLVHWYHRLTAFIFVLIIVSSFVHQGTDLFSVDFFNSFCTLKDFLLAAVIESWYFSTAFTMSVSDVSSAYSVLSRFSVYNFFNKVVIKLY
jgi:hypothetical protein